MTTNTLSTLLASCISDARANGFDGADAEYEYTVADLEYVTDQLGRKPSREEWVAAGLRYVGSVHVGELA